MGRPIQPPRAGVTTLVVIALLTLAGSASTTSAATSDGPTAVHLTSAGWAALDAMTHASHTAATAHACAQLAPNTSDEEASGIVGTCVDEVALGGWGERAATPCGENLGDAQTPPPPALVAMSGSASLRQSCAADVANADTAGSAAAAWDRWFVARLAPGECNTFFGDQAALDDAITGAGAKFVAAVHAGASSSELVRDYQDVASEAVGVGLAYAFSGAARDYLACRP